MNSIELKKNAFEYFLFRLNKEYFEDSKEKRIQNAIPLSNVKIMKLLFFCSVLSKEKYLLSVFDNWWALPKGPVESDAYQCLKGVEGKKVKEAAIKYGHSNDSCPIDIHINVRNYIDEAIPKLKDKDLLSHQESQLVEISHKWNCWKHSFIQGLNFGLRANPINVADIKKELIYV